MSAELPPLRSEDSRDKNLTAVGSRLAVSPSTQILLLVLCAAALAVLAFAAASVVLV